MSNDQSWGLLGKPPASVLKGTHPKMSLFKDYVKEADSVSRMAHGKKKAIRTAELKAKFRRDFPPEV